jgi:hypothetical protein
MLEKRLFVCVVDISVRVLLNAQMQIAMFAAFAIFCGDKS